jgi:hypothetical protein
LQQCDRKPADIFGSGLSERFLLFCQQHTDRDGHSSARQLADLFCPGGSGQYVYLQVFYAMPLIDAVWLPAVTTAFQGQTVKLVSAAAAFKNEPYQSSYTPPAGC